MLEVEIEGKRGKRLARDRAGTRLFAGLDAQGRLDEQAMNATVTAVARMARGARERGAEEVLLFATSATRDASNKEVFASRLREEAQVELTVCSGEEEAALSFLGATGRGRCGVIDIGGGSTEVVVGEGDALEQVFSCQMGAVRLFRAYPITCTGDMRAVEQEATRILREMRAKQADVLLPDNWYGTGGTFTALGAMVRNVPWTDRTYMHGTVVTLADVERLGQQLAGLTLEERRQLVSLQPNRADIVVHGICILKACMDEMRISQIVVSEYGNLDGYVKKHYQLTDGLW